VKLLTLCFLFGAATYVAFPFVHNVYALCAVAFVLGLSMGCGQPLSVCSPTAARRRAHRRGARHAARRDALHADRGTGVFGSVSTALGVAPVFWASPRCSRRRVAQPRPARARHHDPHEFFRRKAMKIAVIDDYQIRSATRVLRRLAATRSRVPHTSRPVQLASG